MSTMQEMAAEYRLAAAKLAMHIQENKEGMAPHELAGLRNALRDVRETAHILSGYYEVPRPESPYTLIGLKARKSRDDR